MGVAAAAAAFVVVVVVVVVVFAVVVVAVAAKVKFSHTRYRALGPELIPVYRQSARR